MKIFCAVVFEALHINFQTIIGNRDIAWQFGLHSFVQTKLMTHVYKICVFGIDFLYQLKRLLNSKMRMNSKYCSKDQKGSTTSDP